MSEPMNEPQSQQEAVSIASDTKAEQLDALSKTVELQSNDIQTLAEYAQNTDRSVNDLLMTLATLQKTLLDKKLLDDSDLRKTEVELVESKQEAFLTGNGYSEGLGQATNGDFLFLSIKSEATPSLNTDLAFVIAKQEGQGVELAVLGKELGQTFDAEDSMPDGNKTTASITIKRIFRK